MLAGKVGFALASTEVAQRVVAAQGEPVVAL